MPDPRAENTHRLGAEPKRLLTFKAAGLTYEPQQPGGTNAAGLAVKLDVGGTVSLADTDQPVFGKLMLLEPDLYCNVQTFGPVELPAAPAAVPTPGQAIVGARNGAQPGFIKGVAPGTAGSAHRVNAVVSAPELIEVDLGAAAPAGA